MNPHRTAVEVAKRVMDWSAPEKVAAMDAAEVLSVVGRLRGALSDLIVVAEAQPKSARLRAQHDQEFLNLFHALRMESHAIKGGVSRAARLADALASMVEPADDENGGQS